MVLFRTCDEIIMGQRFYNAPDAVKDLWEKIVRMRPDLKAKYPAPK